jgi:hypothetical protein
MITQGTTRIGQSWRELEQQGYRVIRLKKDETNRNDPELYAPIVVHNLKSSGLEEAVHRFEKALELRRKGRSNNEIKQLLGLNPSKRVLVAR